MSLAPPDVDGETRAAGQAETAYREALTANPNDAAALHGLGLKFKDDGQLEDALALFTRASQSAGSPMEATIEAGVVSALLGRQQDALRWIGDACRKHSDRYEPHYLLGRMLASQNRYAEAAACFQRALAAPPPDVTDAAKGLIFCLRKLSRFEDAREATQIWARARPDDPACPATLAHIFLEWGKPSEALPHARRAAAMDLQSADNAILVARILVLLDRPDEAETELARAREQQPRNAQILAHLGNTLKIAGKFAEAREALSQALASDPGNATILFELAEITRFSTGDPLIAEMEQLAASSKSRADVSKLHYALGKAYDDADDPDRAFPHFAKANAAQRADSPYDEVRTLSVFEILRSIFTASFLDERRGSGSSSERPIFIVGMPRSGSTLIEQILASHPDIAAAGEVNILARTVERVLPTPAFPDNLRALSPSGIAAISQTYLERITPLAGDRARVTDKLLSNALLVGLIHLAFPNARIIHSMRDPIDTCLSCYMKSFGNRLPYANDLTSLGRYYKMHSGLMAHWRRVLPANSILDVHYENIVGDVEQQARRLVAHCGLDWDDRCISFHETRRPVNTASVWQVREPLYDHAAHRWHRYRGHLQPLLAALGVSAP